MRSRGHAQGRCPQHCQPLSHLTWGLKLGSPQMPVLWIREASTQNCEVEENPNIEVQGGTLTHVQKKLSAFYACRAISLIASSDDICQSALLQVALIKQIPELWTNRGQEVRWKTGTASPWLHKWSDYFHATTWFIIGADKKKKKNLRA